MWKWKKLVSSLCMDGCAVVLCRAFASTSRWKCVEGDYLNMLVYPC